MNITIKVNKEEAIVKVVLPKRTGKMRRQRFYTEDAKRALLEKYPSLEIESVVQYGTVKNDENNEGEWVFLLKKREDNPVVKKKTTSKKTSKKAVESDKLKSNQERST